MSFACCKIGVNSCALSYAANANQYGTAVACLHLNIYGDKYTDFSARMGSQMGVIRAINISQGDFLTSHILLAVGRLKTDEK